MDERSITELADVLDGRERLRIDSLKGRGAPMHKHHFHDFYEVYYMVNGNGVYFINDKVYDIIPGDLIVVPPWAIHSTDYGNKEHERILLEFSETMIPKEIKERIGILPNLYRHPTIARDIYIVLKDIEREYNHPDEFSSDEISNLVKHLLVLLIRNISAAKTVHSKDAVISEVVGFIKENYRTEITLGQLADMHFISPEHLSRTFKKETNFGFNEFITLVRLQRAEYLLKEKNTLSIAEVAYACGFNDSNYFSDKFKKAYGISPLQYSKTYRGKTVRNRKKRKKPGEESAAASESAGNNEK